MSLDSSDPTGPATPGLISLAPFFLSSFAWNFVLGMTFILVPLYAQSLGMQGVQIGTLVAMPVVLQMVFSLLGGAMSDRVGGKNMAMVSCMLTCAAGMVFMVSGGFGMMLAAQLLMVMARAMFWPATWSLASQLPGNPALQMGRLNSATNGGQIAGTAAAGFIIAAAGFRAGFVAMTAVGLLALLLNQMYRHASTAARAPAKPILATYRALLGQRAIRYGTLCAYISALPLSLSFSFYPILLVDQGFSSDATGTFISLRGVGAVAAGMIAGRLIAHVRDIRPPLAAALVISSSVALTAALSQPAVIAILLFALGAGSGIMTVYFQMLISQVSTREMRGSAMALGGLGWSISNLATPLAMGILNDRLGIQVAFYIMGGVAFVSGLLLVPLQRWAFGGKPAAQESA